MTHTTCPDCQGELKPIKLIGRGWENPISKIAADSDLGYYVEAETERSDFSGMYKAKGEIDSYLCSACGRIFLFAK